MRIFHRIDDIGTCSRDMSVMLDFFAETVREFVVAAIPSRLSKRMALQLKGYRNCCVYQHGYQHINRVFTGWRDEFPDFFPAAQTRCLLRDGKHILEDLLQSKVTGYVPPWNNTGKKTVGILEGLGFDVYSAQKSNTHQFKQKLDVNVDIVAIYEPKIKYRAFESVFDEVKEIQCKRDEIGVLYHFNRLSKDSMLQIFQFVRDVESCWNDEEGAGEMQK